jgi:hypothetical protein
MSLEQVRALTLDDYKVAVGLLNKWYKPESDDEQRSADDWP